ncbi:hypothetical protein C8A03DRAFT_33772 [Achaetomium macrosporum]|uniref:Uncharacterized protein n=1 Tax=Achaetomium macrosporum TaxID=79813 RepID=A0AAN7H744_9PEZI|nr:hypothetical protein C8A03DRAFT_33772 [Achaetomium macrosporum]
MSTRVKEWTDREINPQHSSSLYSLIPSEIRDVILAYALTENAVALPLAISSPAIRPSRGPSSTKQHACPGWMSPREAGSPDVRKRGPPWEVSPHTSRPMPSPERFADTIPARILTKIRRLRLYGPLTWLHRNFISQVRDSFIWKACVLRHYPTTLFHPPRIRLFDTIRVLHLTIRTLDWQHHDLNWPLAIDPFANWDGIPAKAGMEAAMAQPPPGHLLRPAHTSWATAIVLIPSLQTLTIDFETTEDKRAELERIVRWAVRAWRFVVLRNPPRVRVPFPGWCPSSSPMPPLEWECDYRWDRFADIPVLWRAPSQLYSLPPGAETEDGRPAWRAWIVARGGMEGVKR